MSHHSSSRAQLVQIKWSFSLMGSLGFILSKLLFSSTIAGIGDVDSHQSMNEIGPFLCIHLPFEICGEPTSFRFSICSSVPRTAVRGHRSELCVVADTAVVLAPAHCQPNFNFHQCGCSHGQRYRYRYKQHSLCGRPFTLLPPLMHFMLRYNAAVVSQVRYMIMYDVFYLM